MREVGGAVGLDLDHVVQRACSATGRSCALPAARVAVPIGSASPRPGGRLELPAALARAAVTLGEVGAPRMLRLEAHDTLAIWRSLGEGKGDAAQAAVLRAQVRELLEAVEAGADPLTVIAIPDPAREESPERWRRVLAGTGRVHLVWRSVLAALGLLRRCPDLAGQVPFDLLYVELGWGWLRANVLCIDRDEASGVVAPERVKSGVETHWPAPAPPDQRQRLGVRWRRDAADRLVEDLASGPEITASAELEARTTALASDLARQFPDRRCAIWLVEVLAADTKTCRNLGAAVAHGLGRHLAKPSRVLHTSRGRLVVRGAAECAHRLATGRPAWYDTLPQLEINRQNEDGSVELVPLVHAQRVRGGETYVNEVFGFALPAGADHMTFVLWHAEHGTARRLQQPLAGRLEKDTPVKLVVEQQPAQGRARVDVVPLERTPKMPRTTLDWQLLEDTGWSRETTLEKLQEMVGVGAVPALIPVAAHADRWSLGLISVLRRFLDCAPEEPEKYEGALDECRSQLQARRLVGQANRVAPVSSDGDLPDGVSGEAARLFEDFRTRLSRDLEVLPASSPLRSKLAVAGAWLYAAAPAAVRAELCSALRKKGHWAVQPAGRCFSEQGEIRLFFACFAEVARSRRRKSSWTKALGQILLYRQDASQWLEPGQACACLEAVLRELERACQPYSGVRRQVLNNALLGLLRFREQCPAFLTGRHDDPVPPQSSARLQKQLDELVDRLQRQGEWLLAEKVREVLAFVQRRGRNQLIALAFDEDDEQG